MVRPSNPATLALCVTCWLSGVPRAHAQRWANSTESVAWRDSWGRFGWPEATTSGIALASALAVSLAARPDSPRWRGPILFDSPFRHALRGGDATQRHRAALASDVLLAVSAAGPVLDALLVAWWQHSSSGVAAQLIGMDALSFAVTSLMVAVSKASFARERPYVYALNCREDPSQPDCGSIDGRRSFVSGHTAMAFTGASLSCLQHRYLGLHGSRSAGAARCALGLAAATATATLRIAADRHWASDVVFGAIVGFAAGWLLPRLVYFRRNRPDEVASVPLPFATRSSLGLTYSGML